MSRSNGHGDAAMEKVLSKRRLHREAIELLVKHDPQRMVDLMALLREWEGEEEGLVDHLKNQYLKHETVQADFLPDAPKDADGDYVSYEGKTQNEHCLLALDAIQAVDVSLRSAVARLFLSRSSPRADAALLSEALHLVNYLQEGSQMLQSHFGQCKGAPPPITRELALLETLRN